ncbi:MAG TPA: trigger factor [Actinomycetota bacterium]|nr:trigger factor [Actinomycetota bacterium]
MKTSAEEIGKNKVRLTVEVPHTDVEKELGRTYRRLAKEVRVPGFRPGKAPRAVIDQRLGRDFVRNEALKDLLPGFYAEAVESSSLDVVAPPSIDIKSFEDGQDLTFEAVVETRPDPQLKEYAGLKVTKPPVDVSDEELADQLERLRVRFASLEVIERPLQNEDFAQIDLTTYRHDETIDELTAKDFLIELGAEMVVPELDAELVGKRKGDILKLTATLPERFGERAGWQVGMQVLVKEAKTRNLPALDDELAKTASEFDTLDELREDIKRRLSEIKEAQAEAALRENVLDAFVKEGLEVEIPEGMVNLEVDALVTSMAQVLSAQGASLQRYMEVNDLDADALRSRFVEQAERNLSLRLGLDAVAAAEGLEATEDDRTKEVERLAARTERDPDDVRELIDDRGDWGSVDGDILRNKALDLLVERAEITIAEEDSAHEP